MSSTFIHYLKIKIDILIINLQKFKLSYFKTLNSKLMTDLWVPHFRKNGHLNSNKYKENKNIKVELIEGNI